MSYDNERSGVLFKNTKKQEGEKTPDYRGHITINGEELDIAAWVRTSGKGNKFMSLKISDKFVPSDNYVPAPATQTEEDLPF